jgi:neutral ceramidase
MQEFNKLAKAMAKGEKTITKGPSPPDLSSEQLKLVLDPFGDSPPPGINFGDMKHDIIGGTFRKGGTASATFWSANPRYDLLTEGTFAVVELLQDKRWVPVYDDDDDDDFSLYFKWSLDNRSLYSKLRHFGSARKTQDSPINYFTGASTAFTVS